MATAERSSAWYAKSSKQKHHIRCFVSVFRTVVSLAEFFCFCPPQQRHRCDWFVLCGRKFYREPEHDVFCTKGVPFRLLSFFLCVSVCVFVHVVRGAAQRDLEHSATGGFDQNAMCRADLKSSLFACLKCLIC